MTTLLLVSILALPTQGPTTYLGQIEPGYIDTRNYVRADEVAKLTADDRRGIELLEAGKYAEAKAHFKAVWLKTPQDVVAFVGFCQASDYLGDPAAGFRLASQKATLRAEDTIKACYLFAYHASKATSGGSLPSGVPDHPPYSAPYSLKPLTALDRAATVMLVSSYLSSGNEDRLRAQVTASTQKLGNFAQAKAYVALSYTQGTLKMGQGDREIPVPESMKMNPEKASAVGKELVTEYPKWATGWLVAAEVNYGRDSKASRRFLEHFLTFPDIPEKHRVRAKQLLEYLKKATS